MNIKQFEDKNLSHFSYAILSDGEMALVDPSRNPEPYYRYAEEMGAKITAVIETHPHADFVSSHLEIHNHTGAMIYASALIGASYPHQGFDEGDEIQLGKINLKSLNTPGHSPDSISIVAYDELGKAHAVFTGDTLFIGDCGRPDLREKSGKLQAKREELAGQLYHSLRNKLIPLPDETQVYPAHGAGSLCGKGISGDKESTMGREKKENWSLQEMPEDEFIKSLLEDQPFIPKYFSFNVDLNKEGAADFRETVKNVKLGRPVTEQDQANALTKSFAIIDTRPQNEYKKQHLKGSINLMKGSSFETWLGSIIEPNEPFYLAAENEEDLTELIERAAKIGYENQIEQGFVLRFGEASTPSFDSDKLKSNPGDYTLIDIRNRSEVKGGKFFENAINLPLHELRNRLDEIPTKKPIVVHCAGGYRSAAGSSLIQEMLNPGVPVYDLSEAVEKFK